jgi:hypothetical protein
MCSTKDYVQMVVKATESSNFSKDFYDKVFGERLKEAREKIIREG